MTTFILVWLLIGLVTFAWDMARTRTTSPLIIVVAFIVHLFVGAFLLSIGVINVSLQGIGYVNGLIVNAYMKGYNQGIKD